MAQFGTVITVYEYKALLALHAPFVLQVFSVLLRKKHKSTRAKLQLSSGKW